MKTVVSILVLAAFPCACARSNGGIESESATATTTSARVEVVRAEGIAPERVHAMIAPAVRPLERCVPGKGGTIMLRLRGDGAGVHVDVAPVLGMDESARACASAALVEVPLADTASNAGGPGIPPSGFTSLVTISR
jgi:hypothetical protein